MDTKDFVTYQQAVDLANFGFDECCTHYYFKDDPGNLCEVKPTYFGLYNISFDFNYEEGTDFIDFEDHVSAPTLWQAQMWLYRTFGVWIIITTNNKDCKHKWCCIIKKIVKTPEGNSNWTLFRISKKYEFPTPEKALSGGITECLKFLLE